MLPFSIMNVYGNIIPEKEYNIHSSGYALFIHDPSTNKLYSFGSQRGYDTGINDGVPNPTYALPRLAAENVKRVFSSSQRGGGGSMFFCYESTDNKIMACGSRQSILGQGRSDYFPGWTNITQYFNTAGIILSDIKDITCFYDKKLNVVMNDGTLYCSGKNNTTDQTSFGNGNNIDSFGAFTKINTITNVKKAIGNLYLTTSGNLYGTGINNSYQLGNNTTTSINTLSLLATGVEDIDSSYTTNYYLKNSELYGFGTTLGSQYGDEFGRNGSTAQTVLKIPTVIRTDVDNFWVSVGNPSCHVQQSLDFTLYNTGINNQGQLSLNNLNPVYTFTQVQGYAIPNIKSVGSNGASLIMLDNNFYYCGNAVVFGESPTTFKTVYTLMNNIPF